MPIIPFILTYWRQISYAICVFFILGVCWYVQHVFAQKAYYESLSEKQQATIASMEAGLKAYVSLNEDIRNDLSKQNAKLRDRIKDIEGRPMPPDGTRFVFMSMSSLHR